MFFKRKEPASDIPVVADLDRIISKSVAIILNGKKHIIRPITSAQFFLYAAELAKLNDILPGNPSKKEIIDQCFAVVSQICPSLTHEDVRTASDAQMAGLYRVIIDAVTGYRYPDNEKKNMKMKGK
jgi:hypothetical protein